MKHETKERNKKLRARYYQLRGEGYKNMDIIEQLQNEFFLSASQIIQILYSKRYQREERV